MKKAVCYCRTSSQANTKGDSYHRQMAAITSYAKANNYQIVQSFYDQAVSGTINIQLRPKFAEMLNYCTENGIVTILCESPDRYSRDVITAETGYQYLKQLGLVLIPVSVPDYFSVDTPTNTLIRNILSSISLFDKSTIVNKLAVARARKRLANGGKCEGRKRLTETAPDAVSMARKLASRRKQKPSLRDIAMALEQAGFVNAKGKRFDATSVRSMLNRH